MRKKTLLRALGLVAIASLALALCACFEPEHTVHHYIERVASAEHIKSEATCTAGAVYYYSCECGENGTATFAEGEPLSHSFTNYVADGDATCTQDGTKTAKCDRCAVTDTVTDAQSALGHSFTSYVSNNDATCAQDGTKSAECDRCTATDTLTDEGSVLEHTFSDGWLSSASEHWHPTLCGHDLKKDQGTHVWGDDLICDVCMRAEERVAITEFVGATVNGISAYMLVDKDTAQVSLSGRISCPEGATWALYSDAACINEIGGALIGSLPDGDSVYYIKVTVTDAQVSVVYTLTVHRSYAVTVTYRVDGNVVHTESAYTGYEFGTDYVPSVPAGYSFGRWLLDGEAYAPSVLSGDLTLDADLVKSPYKITLNANGGTVLKNEIKVYYGEEYTLPTPTKDGYTFDGWYDEYGTLYGGGIFGVENDLQLFAYWTKKANADVGGTGIQLPFYPC